MSEKAQILDLAAQSNVTISALDARGLHTAQMGAGERGASSTMEMVTGYDSQSHSDSVTFNPPLPRSGLRSIRRQPVWEVRVYVRFQPMALAC
jgi:hypothetical protein